MTGIFDPFCLWIPLGILAVVLPVINLFRLARGRTRGRQLLTAAGFLAAMLELLTQYAMAAVWVSGNDWSALMDVVPAMTGMLTLFVVVTGVLNFAAVFLGREKKA